MATRPKEVPTGLTTLDAFRALAGLPEIEQARIDAQATYLMAATGLTYRESVTVLASIGALIIRKEAEGEIPVG